MKKIYHWNKKSSPYNSLNIYAHFIGDMFNEIYGIESSYIYPDTDNFQQVIRELTQPDSDVVIFWHYGVFDYNIRYITDFSKVVFVYHNITPAKYFWLTNPISSLRAIGTYMQLYFLNENMKWITVSTFNKNCLARFHFKNINECPVIPYMIKYGTINAVKQESCTLLYVGRITENKNCLKLIDCIKEFAQLYHSSINFVVVGKCSSKLYGILFEKAWNKLSSIKHLKCKWYSDLDEKSLVSLYQSSWLYVTTSLHEGLGMPVCEAILNGTPAIYLECGGQESILNSIGMVELKKENVFATKILELIVNPEKKERLLQMQNKELRKKAYPNCKQLIKNIYGKYIE